MKIAISLFFYIFELIALLMGALLLLGVLTSDPFPQELFFWRCVSWSACFISSSFTYLGILLVPLIILHWALALLKKRR